jgi:hypothetical protein
MAMFSTQKQQNLNPVRTWQRRLARQRSAVAATAQTFTFDIPRDHFIHEIHITVYETTTPCDTRQPTMLVDDIVSLTLTGNGNKVLKDGLGSMFKQVMRIEKRTPQTGLYTLFFSSGKIPEAKPLPAWVFTSLQLLITDNAPAAQQVHCIEIVITESAYEQQDLSNWRVIVEKYLKWAHYGVFAGEQDYEHERAYNVFCYLYLMDDNAVPSATIFDLIKVLARKPEGELTVIDVPVPLLKAENDSEIQGTTGFVLDVGYFYIEWVRGFPAHEFASLYSKPNIPTAGTNVGLRVLERYTL